MRYDRRIWCNYTGCRAGRRINLFDSTGRCQDSDFEIGFAWSKKYRNEWKEILTRRGSKGVHIGGKEQELVATYAGPESEDKSSPVNI